MSSNPKILAYQIKSQYMLALTQPAEVTRKERREAKRAVKRLASLVHENPRIVRLALVN